MWCKKNIVVVSLLVDILNMQERELAEGRAVTLVHPLAHRL
ncbi:hypothetical protein [Desulfotalea psychrophila]|nr:hypothetical protein [Desulfotalea psychrophila]